MSKEKKILTTVLSVLNNEHFNVMKNERIFWRDQDGFKEIIYLRPSKYSKEEFDIFFGLFSSDLMEQDVELNENNLRRHFIDNGFFHPLSQTRPLESSYWWGEGYYQSEIRVLKRQIENLALPFFESFKNYADFANIVIESSSFKKSVIEKIQQIAANKSAAPIYDDKNAIRRAQEAFSFWGCSR